MICSFFRRATDVFSSLTNLKLFVLSGAALRGSNVQVNGDQLF